MIDILVITFPSVIVVFILSSTLAYIIPMAFKAFFASPPQPAATKSSTVVEEKHPQSASSSTRNNTRLQHDMIAVNALNISRRRRSKNDDPAVNGTTTENSEYYSAGGTLNRALDDLDRAASYSNDGKLEQSLTLYQSSLDVLIKAIYSSPTNEATTDSMVCAKDRIWLKERVKAALTDAEHIKAKLDSYKQQPSQQQPLLSSRTPTAMNRTSSSRRSQLLPTTSMKNAAVSSFPLVSNKRAAVPPSEKIVKKDDMTQLIFSDIYVDSATLSTRWSDVVGLQRAKQALQEAVILPMLRPDLYTNLRSPPRAVLLYGPPGTGKTLIVKAVAYESKCSLFSCSASSLTSKWVGESEKLLRTLFHVAESCAPSIIFVDEIDSLLSKRSESEHEASRRFKTEFMVQMDGCKKDTFTSVEGDATANTILVIGCTNCPWDIDDAIMRRFQRRIYIPLPDAETRKAVLQSILNKCTPHSLSKQQLMQLVNRTEGYSCSDLTSVGSDAAFGPLRSLGGIEEISQVNPKDIRPVSFDDFLSALQSYPRSISKASLQRYSQWEKELESGTHDSSR